MKTMKMPNICSDPRILTRWTPPVQASVIRRALFLGSRKVRSAVSENITNQEGTARRTNTQTLHKIRLERLYALVALGHLLPGSGSETLAANVACLPPPASSSWSPSECELVKIN